MPESFNLIVCGATDYKNGFILSDFMGFCMALRGQGAERDSLSCFGIREALFVPQK